MKKSVAIWSTYEYVVVKDPDMIRVVTYEVRSLSDSQLKRVRTYSALLVLSYPV